MNITNCNLFCFATKEIEVVLVGSKPKLAYDAFDSNPNIVGPGLKNQNQTILY